MQLVDREMKDASHDMKKAVIARTEGSARNLVEELSFGCVGGR